MLTISKFVTDNGITIFRVSGKMIFSTIEKLKASVDSAVDDGDLRIVLNGGQVDIIDSAALGFMISRSRTVKIKGGAFCFCEGQPALLRLLKMIDSDKWLDVFATEEDAVAHIESALRPEE